ncbi:MAG: glutaredoxin family protein [Candidatus Geothermincolia bacterium]
MIELDCLQRVEGSKDEHDLVLFALSTCPHCKHAREFLDSNGLTYRYVYVDQLEGPEQKLAVQESEKYNPNRTFPTLVIDDGDVVIGFREVDYKDKLL